MKERMVYVTCPHCGHVFQIKRDTISIAGMNSIIDERLENGTHFTHVCQNCREPFYMMYPFLYRDPQKKYNIVLTNQWDLKNLPTDEKKIQCSSVSQFLLAYKVCSQQLNFSLIIAKKKLMDNKYGITTFDGYDDVNQCLWFTVKHEKKAVLLKDIELQQVFDR